MPAYILTPVRAGEIIIRWSMGSGQTSKVVCYERFWSMEKESWKELAGVGVMPKSLQGDV
jgi:hypothetical protein